MSGDEQGEWAVLDELLGMEALADKPVDGEGIGRLAFYGRCSTEDNQDPKTSLAWQMGEASRFVEPLGVRSSSSTSTLASRVRCLGSGGTRPVGSCMR